MNSHVPVADPVEEACPWVLERPARSPRALRRHDRFARARDLGILVVTSVFWVPALGLVALLIQLEEPRSSVFFRQPRTGRGGVPFQMLKFRSMVEDAEERKHELKHLNEVEWPDFKITDDPRVTRVGRFIRATSLDELPQLINVLRGELALVGPRPTSFAAETYGVWQTERLEPRPGLTGLWQVVARDGTEFVDRSRLDIAYVRRRSLSLDVAILTRTFGAVVRGEGS